MRSFVTASPLALVGVMMLTTVGSARALVVAALSVSDRVMRSDAVVVGSVTALEPNPVQAKAHPKAQEKTAYTIAVLKVDEALTGLKGVTHVRVGFVPQAAQEDPPVQQIGNGNILVRSAIARIPSPTLAAGQAGMFFLSRHPGADFYVLTPMAPPVEQKGDALKPTLEQARAVIRVLDRPIEALQAEDAAARLEAASILIWKHRNPRSGGRMKQEPISAEESRLILKTLAETTDWQTPNPKTGMQPLSLFYQLGLTQADGWTQPKPNRQPGVDYQKEVEKAARAWLKAHPDYRLKRWVLEEQ